MTPDSTPRAGRRPASTASHPDEYDALMRANAAYKERFGMPFVICVERARQALDHRRAAQERVAQRPRRGGRRTALREVAKIAKLSAGRMMG